MGRLIYVETSIPSFYFDTRSAVELRARRNWTRHWWDHAAPGDERVISDVVMEEIERAPEPKRARCLGLVATLPLLPYTDEVAEIVETYHRHKVMPVEASADADHLALATFHRCDMLVTWNCQHIANATSFRTFVASTRCSATPRRNSSRHLNCFHLSHENAPEQNV